MIISHKHRFIFIKTNKTAGTSIEIGLSRFCGTDDIITPVSGPDELLREEFGGVPPQNYQIPLYRYGLKDYYALIGRKTVGYYNHMSASEIKRLIGSKTWNSFFKFCFERNPWDRVISHYYWRLRREPRPPMSEFLESKMLTVLKQRGINLYTIDGEVVVDKVYRYESLKDDLEDVRMRLSLPAPVELPNAKASFRTDRRSYREILEPRDRERIAELFKDEIRILGYKF